MFKSIFVFGNLTPNMLCNYDFFYESKCEKIMLFYHNLPKKTKKEFKKMKGEINFLKELNDSTI